LKAVKAALEKAAAVAFEMEVLTAVLKVPGTTKKRKQRVAEQMIPEILQGSSSYKQGKFHRAWKTHEHLPLIDKQQGDNNNRTSTPRREPGPGGYTCQAGTDACLSMYQRPRSPVAPVACPVVTTRVAFCCKEVVQST
jgi:hypothetical protein